jgi:hypothetical protein
MKFKILATACALGFSIVAVADGAKPAQTALAHDSKGAAILGCGFAGELAAAVVFREGGDLKLQDFELFLKKNHVTSIVGHRNLRASGVTVSQLDREGSTELASIPFENWSEPAPEGTFFTARGNYRGFFLFNGGKSASLAYGTPDGTAVDGLTCTSDFAQLQAWVDAALAFRPQ